MEAARARALEEATLLLQFGEFEQPPNGQALSPQPENTLESLMVSGFDFSIDEVRRNLRLAAAKRTQFIIQPRPIRKAA